MERHRDGEEREGEIKREKENEGGVREWWMLHLDHEWLAQPWRLSLPAQFEAIGRQTREEIYLPGKPANTHTQFQSSPSLPPLSLTHTHSHAPFSLSLSLTETITERALAHATGCGRQTHLVFPPFLKKSRNEERKKKREQDALTHQVLEKSTVKGVKLLFKSISRFRFKRQPVIQGHDQAQVGWEKRGL